MAIRNIIFDLGNVLIGYDFEQFFTGMGCLPHSHTLQDVAHIVAPFDAGEISTRQFIDRMQQFLGSTVSDAEFTQLWTHHFFPMDVMLNLAAQMAQEYNVFLLSNTDELHYNYIYATWPQLRIFDDHLMLSYQLGANKPQDKIYLRALEAYQLYPDSCLFIDDVPQNIETASRLGFHTILHRDASSTKKQLTDLLQSARKI